LSSTAQGVKDNRHKYQGNEYIKDLGLNWMDFHARQYDPQIGRFLAIDPLADDGGQQVFSPYAAMGNAPESMVDPNGTLAFDVSLGASKLPPHELDVAIAEYYKVGNFNSGSDWVLGQAMSFLAERQQKAFENRFTNEFKGLVGAINVKAITGQFQCVFYSSSESTAKDYNPIDGDGGSGSSGDPFTIWEYSTYYRDEIDNNGIKIRLSINQALSAGYQKTDWIQSITTSNTDAGNQPMAPYNDYKREDKTSRPPFYYSGSDMSTVKQQEYQYSGKFFSDGPGRRWNSANYVWTAELSLVGMKNGKWQNIISFTYGYISIDSRTYKMPLLPFTLPSAFQQELIESLNKKK